MGPAVAGPWGAAVFDRCDDLNDGLDSTVHQFGLINKEAYG
jgi:hypothetical protein